MTARFAGRSTMESVSRSERERSNLSALIITYRMGIDIYAEWDGMTEAEKEAQVITGCSVVHGHVGYLRETSHHEMCCAAKLLIPEAFMFGRAPIAAATLRRRLPETLRLAEKREREVYGVTDAAQIERVLKSYRDFVALCAQKEFETGHRCLIIAS